MSLRPELFENFLKYINENYNIESFDQLKEIFLLESEKIFKHIYINMKDYIIQTKYQTLIDNQDENKEKVEIIPEIEKSKNISYKFSYGY